jgi:hypothetical protein
MRRQNGFSGVTSSSPVEFRGKERRCKPRIYVSFPAIVRAVRNGERLEANTRLENISARGLYLRMDQPIEPATSIFVLVYFTTTTFQEIPAPRVAIRGIVRRVELHADDSFGVAVAVTHHRFL